MNYILDAYIALAWCFGDESTPHTIELLEWLISNAAYVPQHWSLEVSNALLAAERCKRISYASVIEFTTLLSQLNIKVDGETSSRSCREILSLAHSKKLTTYNAAYIELALRMGLPLASKDAELLKTAKNLGVKLV